MHLRLGLAFAFATLFTATASAQYITGFENPPFNTGPISGQDFWTINQNADTSRVQTADQIAADLTAAGVTPGMTVHSGTQALVLANTATVTGSAATTRPVSGLETSPLVTLDVWARPLPAQVGSIGNVFLVMEDANSTSTSGRSAAFRFGPSTIDYGSSVQAGVWRTTNIQWNSDTWYHFTMTLDYLNKAYNFAVDGVQINIDPIPFYHLDSTEFSTVRIFRGAGQAGMLVDDLVIQIPEPASTACLLAAGCLVLLRPRSRA